MREPALHNEEMLENTQTAPVWPAALRENEETLDLSSHMHYKHLTLGTLGRLHNIFATLFCPSCLIEPLLTKQRLAALNPVFISC